MHCSNLFLLELISRLDMTTVYRLSGWAGHFNIGLNLNNLDFNAATSFPSPVWLNTHLVMSAVRRMPGKVLMVL